jgi:hypothetical protein
MPEESRQILLNTEIIAVNQDRLGRQGWRAEIVRSDRVWVRELEPSRGGDCDLNQSDSWAVVLENRSGNLNEHHITFDPTKHIPNGASWASFTVRDLFLHEDLGVRHERFTAVVDESSVRIYKIVAQKIETVVNSY